MPKKPRAPTAAELELHASAAASLLRELGNERRLLVLCTLTGGEANVGTLSERAGLTQPAMSQHLARLREEGLVATRRAGTTIYYRLADPRIAKILATLREIFCADLA